MYGYKTEEADEGRSDTTIGDLSERLASNENPTGEDLHALAGFRRLAAIAEDEFSSELDLLTLEKLRGLLSSFQTVGTDRFDDLTLRPVAEVLGTAEGRSPPGRLIDHFPVICYELGTDWVDRLTLAEAAELLEAARGQSPSGRLIDQAPATCARCGGRLSDDDRAWRQGWCEDCRSPTGKVSELDVAFRTETRSYDQFGRDPLDRFAEWPAISTYICNKYSVNRVELTHWDRFLKEFQTEHKISRESLLAMRLTDLVAGPDQDRKADEGKKSGSKKKGRPPGTDREKDRRIYEAWKTRSFASYEDLAKKLRLSSKHEVRRALDRHRHRLRSEGKKPPRKPRQEP
jgi:hypothetical protein